MDEVQQENYRTQLIEMLKTLEAEDQLGEEGQRTVELDQQAVGRLSRMDALQNQAMAKAGQARRNVMRQRIAAALTRMEEDEYGYCADCGEDIAPARLDLDPTAPKCLSCASG